jgi:hypothetical protein
MDTEKYFCKVNMLCPICGNDQFRYEEDDVQDDDCIFECLRCGLKLAKIELIERNSGVINAEAAEIGQEALGDFSKELKQSLKKALRGNKHIKNCVVVQNYAKPHM